MTRGVRMYVRKQEGSRAPTSVTMVTESCCECGNLFAMTEAFAQQRQSDRARFYCPNGHGQAYLESTEQQLRRRLANVEEDLRITKVDQAKTERDLRRALARAGNGVCPCCHRSFPALADHVRSQHPDFVDDEDLPVQNSLGQRRCAGCMKWLAPRRSDGLVRNHVTWYGVHCAGSGEEPIGGRP